MDLRKNLIDTFAGTGERQPTPGGAQVAGTPLNGPRAIDFDADGNMFRVLREGNVVPRITGGRYHLPAGTGEKGYAGDGGDAKRARLTGPKAIRCGSASAIYIADPESHTIRRIDRRGIITTVVGAGERGDGPVGNPLQCRLSKIYIADSESHRVRVLDRG